MADLSKNFGGAAVFAGSAVGGAVLGDVASSKITFFNGIIGRILLIALGILMIAKSKSDAMKGFGAGIAVSGAKGFITNIAGTFNGLDGFDGMGSYDDLDGVGVGELVQGPDGMLYMMNGLGDLEPYYGDLNGMGNYDDLDGMGSYDDLDGMGYVDYEIAGASGVGAIDPAMAAA